MNLLLESNRGSATICLTPARASTSESEPSSNSRGVEEVSVTNAHRWSGQRIGEYEIGPLLGEGGNGQVYQAHHRWLDIPVAIKFLFNHHPQDATATERFRREGMTSAKLIHPGLVRATDGGMVGAHCFLVSEFVDGADLAAILQRRRHLSVAEVCTIIAGAAEALQFIAGKNAVHRDIKPSNLMVDCEGRVRVLDFGLARTNLASQTMTETGQLMGTFDFMAPEQALDPRKVDFRADVYSLGCTFYYLLTGQAPFQSDRHESIGAKLLAHLEEKIVPISRYRQDVPQAILELIDRMLNSEPRLRPNSFEEVRQTILRASPSVDLGPLVGRAAEVAPATNKQPWLDHFCDDLVAWCKLGFQYVLVGLGILQLATQGRSHHRARFQYSWRWVKYVAFIGLVAVLLWATGFHIVTVDPNDPNFQPY